MAELLLTNAQVYGDGAWRPGVDSIAVRDGVIVGVGAHAELVGLVPSAEVTDLGGAWVLPGFQDAHVHPVQAGLEMNGCNLTGGQSITDYVDAITAYALAHPHAEWITGGGWSMEAFPRGVPTAAVLDRIVSDRPVFLPNRDHHSAWVNTVALERAGITAATPDPVDGRIERDDRGEPTGTLHEGAMELMHRLVPPPSDAEIAGGLLTAQAYLHSLGITGWQDALVGNGLGMPDSLDAYLAAQRGGTLTAKVVGALWWDRDRGEEQVADLVERRERAAAAGFDASTVKIMQDGVCETFTAAVVDPYLDRHGQATDNRGLSFIEAADLARYVQLLDAEDFQVHIHALGDRAVRDSLDAIEHAAVNGPRGNRHQLAHLQIVRSEDVPRFAVLDVTANAQPLWACLDDQMRDLTLPFLGAAARERQYVFRSLLDSGARLAFGSDWPVSSPDPLLGIHVAVNRVPPGTDAEPLLAGQRLTVAEAIEAYTQGSAYLSRRESTSGTIDIGMAADLAVIDADILAIDPTAIESVRVTRTYAQGQLVSAS